MRKYKWYLIFLFLRIQRFILLKYDTQILSYVTAFSIHFKKHQ